MRLRLKPTKKVLIILGVVAAASLGLAYFVYGKQVTTRKEWDGKLKAKQTEASDVEGSAKQLPASEAQLADLQYRVSFLKPSDDDEFQPSLLTEVTALAKQSGVTVSTFSPSEAAPKAKSPAARISTSKKLAPHRFQTLNLTLQGTFHDVARFLYRLAGVSKIFSVDTLQVAPAAEDRPDAVRVSVQATAYVLKQLPPETLAAAAMLQDILAAEEKLKTSAGGYGTLAELKAAGLIQIKEGETVQGYQFTTDKKTSKSSFKILAVAKDKKLHSLSVNQAKKLMDDTDKTPYD